MIRDATGLVGQMWRARCLLSPNATNGVSYLEQDLSYGARILHPHAICAPNWRSWPFRTPIREGLHQRRASMSSQAAFDLAAHQTRGPSGAVPRNYLLPKPALTSHRST